MRNWFINYYGFTLLQKEIEEEYLNKFNTKLENNKMVTDLQINQYVTDHAKMLKLYTNIILYINSLIDKRQDDHTALMQKITREKLDKFYTLKGSLKHDKKN